MENQIEKSKKKFKKVILIILILIIIISILIYIVDKKNNNNEILEEIVNIHDPKNWEIDLDEQYDVSQSGMYQSEYFLIKYSDYSKKYEIYVLYGQGFDFEYIKSEIQSYFEKFPDLVNTPERNIEFIDSRYVEPLPVDGPSEDAID